MHTIIVPTDFSATALISADYAMALALKTGARVILFHAFHMTDEERTSSLGLFARRKNECLEKMETERSRLSGKSSIRIDVVCDYGPADILIARLAAHENADLIVVGTKNYVSTGSAAHNRLAISLINNFNLPVLSVPDKPLPQTLSKQVG